MDVPDEYKTQEMCDEAFRYDERIIKYIPTRFLTLKR
jgi:hypothetical protein